MVCALTIDVEDYFQVTAFDSRLARSAWENLPSRVVSNTRALLEIFNSHGVHGTFFVLGWVAERFPELVREIVAGGHELGSHSYWHHLIYQQTPAEFREDLRRSKGVLEQASGQAVTMYRAPTFSITARSQWALEILVEEGIAIDSSIFPIAHHDRYGMPGVSPEIHERVTPAGSIWEAPMSVARIWGKNIPIGGGGYFRLYPYALTAKLFRRALSAGQYINFYLHPWEIDPDQPRPVKLSAGRRWRHYVNLSRTRKKLERLLRDFAFVPLGQVVKSAQTMQAGAVSSRS